MQTTSRYRLRWWMVYWWLAGCVLVNFFVLTHGPVIFTVIAAILYIIPLSLGGVFALWVILLFIGKTDLSVWLTRWQCVLCLILVSLFGLSPALYIYGSTAWVAEQTLEAIESKYGVKTNILERGPDWVVGDDEWGPSLLTTWRLEGKVKTDKPEQFMLHVMSDLRKHGWEGGALTETHFGLQCSNITFPRLPLLGPLTNNINVIHVNILEAKDKEVVSEVVIYFAFDAVNLFSSQCRL